MVLTESGYKEISDVQIGDFVWAFNDSTGGKALKQVVNTFIHNRDKIYEIYIGQGVIEATNDHPFFVNGSWVKVENLVSGDTLNFFGVDKGVIDSIKVVSGSFQVYNFEVKDFHTYFVSEKKVLVHNGGPCRYDLIPKLTTLKLDYPFIRGALSITSKYKGKQGVYVHRFKGDIVYIGQADNLGKRPRGSLLEWIDSNNRQYKGKGKVNADDYLGTDFYELDKNVYLNLDHMEGDFLNNKYKFDLNNNKKVLNSQNSKDWHLYRDL